MKLRARKILLDDLCTSTFIRMPANYDKWDRLVTATLRREQLRETAMRTPSNLSSASSQSFNLGAQYGRVSSSSLLVGDSFPYHQILVATEFFHDSRLLKHGRSGDFFSGVLESGMEVVVKKISVEKGLNLQSEMDIYGMLDHPRMLPLMGHCLNHAADNSKELAIWGDVDDSFLVYKYMPNGDLSRFLSSKDDRDRQSLNWTTRLKIAVGVAEGLCYLHHQCSLPVVHRDIQATSILLDDEFEVRLGSLTGICFEENSSTARFLRLPKGFEKSKSGVSNATCAYDVYCFGKVLLELVTGKLGPSAVSESSMKGWLANTLRYIVSSDNTIVANIIDSSLITDEHLLVEVWAVSFLAKACLNPKPSKRPMMAEILKELEHLKLARLIADELNPGPSSTLLSIGSLITTSTSVRDYPNGEILSHSGNLRIFKALELKRATRNFAWENLIGEDEFGRVYRGLLDDDPVPVISIKRMYLTEIPQLESELDLLGRISHPNILSPFGYCWNRRELVLVFEFMEGSLQKHLSGSRDFVMILPWEKRLKVLMGAARGLAFLHASEKQGLFLHKQKGEGFYGYLKSSKILIDSDYNAKITGFTVAEVCTSGFVRRKFDEFVRNKFGESWVEKYYLAPEFDVLGGRSLLESDVYGFGVILMAMLTGGETYKHISHIEEIGHFRSMSDLVFETAELEPLQSITTKTPEAFRRKMSSRAVFLMATLALSCVRQDYKLRPSMDEVVQLLEELEKA